MALVVFFIAGHTCRMLVLTDMFWCIECQQGHTDSHITRIRKHSNKRQGAHTIEHMPLIEHMRLSFGFPLCLTE